MEGRTAEQPTPSAPPERPDDARGPHFLLYAIAALVAVTGTAVLAIVLIATSGVGGGSDEAEGQPASGFVFFEETHASILVEPGTTGENALDLLVGRHDGADPGVTSLTVSVADPNGGASLGDFQAEPVSDSPGTYEVAGVDIPSAGDWQFTITIETEKSGSETQSTLIAIGEPAKS
jgi:hypothetical protein